MILVDTSVWVEFDRATGSRADRRLTELIRREAAIAVSEPIVMELAAAARTDEQETQIRRLLSRFTLLRIDPVTDFDGASRVYRRCRKAGVTPRGLIDCLVAAVALRHGATLLARDSDLAAVAGVVGLALDSASTGG